MTVSGSDEPWSEKDRQTIVSHGLTIEEAERQLALLRRGVPAVRLNRPCIAGDGIVVIPDSERPSLLAAFEEARLTHRIMKFVPASGAASRMFREWHCCQATGGFADEAASAAFAADLKRYPFFPELREILAASGEDVESRIGSREEAIIIKAVLAADGLNYGALPKALLKFHSYPEGSRTALEEHLVEAALYARDADNVCRLHFTVSPEHETAVRKLLSQTIGDYESRFGAAFNIAISTQDPSTDTIALDRENRLSRDDLGKPVFRPGGHGSLLSNLDLLDEDIIFLKNIDNIVQDRLKTETSLWKILLAGFMILLQQEIFDMVRLLVEGGVTEAEIARISRFAEQRVNIFIPEGFPGLPLSERRSLLFRKLNRPLRVCGMVRNEGEPGGGPFWVEGEKGKEGISLQIIEEFQINRNNEKQRAIWSSATHFNPVDLVCGVRDFQGKKFDLSSFVDPETAAITRKSEKGRELIALERPGLWNGAMAYWNTVFVEVPLTTFNPVKTVTDLLRPQHLSS